MRITALVENTAKSGLKAKHGLSFYIETKKHKILFDLGPDDTVFGNAAKMGIDLSKADTVIISHGHYDHGGALKSFLEINSDANVYVQKAAFEPYFSKVLLVKVPIGLDSSLKEHRQVKLLEGDYKIDDELFLFTVTDTDKLRSSANDSLYDKNGRDKFLHEQNLIISEEKTALILGCGHAGVTNIMEKAAEYKPDVCIGGFHLYNPTAKKTVADALLDDISAELGRYENTKFYTCHCTGEEAFDYLSKKMKHLDYISCGDVLEI